MFTVVLIVQIMITVALVVVVLLQRSEGGALGIGGGGGGGGLGGLMTGRGAANLLTRTTAILAAAFFTTSIVLTIIARNQSDGGIEFDSAIIEGTTDVEEGAINVQDMLSTTNDAVPEGAEGASEVPEDVVAPVESKPVEEGPVIPDEDG